MTRESVVSFFLALGVVSGSLYAFAYLGGMGSLHQAHAAQLPPASSQTATQAPAASGPIQTALNESAQVAQAELPEDTTVNVAEAKPRCRLIAHQLHDIDGALTYPLSQPLKDYYGKRHEALKAEQTSLAC